jgi:3-oxoacyl-[acyl-carrier protein] reductase
MNIKDKVIVVTGAAQGLGQQIANRLGNYGGLIALVDINLEKLEQVKLELESQKIRSECFVANVSDESQVNASFNAIFNKFGRLDALVNNAGIIRDQFLNKANRNGEIESLTLSNWQSVIDVNLTGVFLCAREASRIMIENKQNGAIVNISSISRAGNMGQSNYSAAKAGVVALTVTWAKELARNGIRVGAIAPGFIQTDMTDSIKPEVLKHIESSIPLGRMGQPDEIAHTVQFILENDYFSGRLIEIDGGLRI